MKPATSLAYSAATLKALKQSIAHWRRLATGKEKSYEDASGIHCALCDSFFNGGCEGCPVAEKTGMKHCQRTPYMRALLAYERWERTGTFKDEASFRDRAKEELAFLESLLPKKPRKKATK